MNCSMLASAFGEEEEGCFSNNDVSLYGMLKHLLYFNSCTAAHHKTAVTVHKLYY